MGREQFTGLARRPTDVASQEGSQEEFSQRNQTVAQNTSYNTAITLDVGSNNDTETDTVFIQGASVAFLGGLAVSADLQWRLEIEDENNNQKWLKYAREGGTGNGPIDVPGVRAENNWSVDLEVRNQTGSSVELDGVINYRTV
jgi:hypothetical protein